MSADADADNNTDRVLSQIRDTLEEYTTWHGSDDSCETWFGDTDPDQDIVLPTGDRIPVNDPDPSPVEVMPDSDRWPIGELVVTAEQIEAEYQRAVQLIGTYRRQRESTRARIAIAEARRFTPNIGRFLSVCCVTCGSPAQEVTYEITPDHHEYPTGRLTTEFVYAFRQLQRRSLTYYPCGHRITAPPILTLGT